MADSKVSELTAATSAAAADKLYLVQGTDSKSLTTAALFGSIPTPAVFNDKVSIGDHDTITAAGAIQLSTNVTWINDVSSAGECTLAAGSDGQIKIIIMIPMKTFSGQGNGLNNFTKNRKLLELSRGITRLSFSVGRT